MYLLATINDIHIIDLEQTIPMIRRALRFVKKVCELRGKILCTHLRGAGVPADQRSAPSATRLSASLRGIPLAAETHRTAPLRFAHQRGEKEFVPEALLSLKNKQNSLVREATKLQISILSIVDSDTRASGIQYPVPANDDLCIYQELVLDAILEAEELRP
jgi:small subunit ribosomal protein S2